MKQLFHTPEGVRDIYSDEYARKLVTMDRIRNVIGRYAYREIQTPSFEYFDIFNKERGSVVSREMYKFFDRDNNTLVLRPDMTPPIARCAAKYYTDEKMPIRLSYLANTFINYASYQGRLNESTVQGAELIGDASSDADAEMIALTIDCLLASGLRDFQVDIGEVEFFNGLCEEAGLDEDTIEELRRLIEEKNFFGVEEIVMEQNMNEKLTDIFLKLPELFGSADLIEKAKAMTVNERSERAIRRLESLYRILSIYGLSDYVTFDLGMLGKFKYYTGIIFKGVTYGTGEPIASGGRYDILMKQFGKDAPSVGFSINIDGLMLALSRQNILPETPGVDNLIIYDKERQEAAIALAGHYRKNGRNVQLTKKLADESTASYKEYAARNSLGEVLYLAKDENDVRVLGENGLKVRSMALPYGISK